MNALLAEMLKLRRSALWVVVVILPLLSVITGTVNYLMNTDAFQLGWDSLWDQVTLFYGLVFCSVGVATLASAVWRMEHRGNWPRLMAGPTSSWQIVGAKLGALTVLVVAMQGVLLVATWGAGVGFAGMPAVLPGRFAVGAAVSVVAALSVAALHSLISMQVRSFAAPIAVAVLGCVGAIALLLRGAPAVVTAAVPYALVQRSLSLGSSAVTTAATLDWASVAAVLVPALALVAALTAGAAAVLDRQDIHA